MQAGLLGCITQPGQRNPLPSGVRYCCDNGVFGAYLGDAKWWEWLSSRPDKDRCEFAVAPDVVGDSAATLARSRPWLPRIRSLGIPAAFVAQDGQENLPVPWGEFDVLFIGGTTEFKLGVGARALIGEAVVRGIPVHMGRVNSRKRLAYAFTAGCASVDGTYLKFGPDLNLPKLLRWIDEIHAA